jgi:phosphotriesterase-related protein
MKSEQILDEILKSLQVGIGSTDVKAGIIGEIGSSVPLHPFERESLIAAAKAQRKTGVAINIHPDIWEFGHIDVLDILEAAGADLNRIVMSHMDEVVDTDWHCRIAERGVYLGFDTFGSEFSYDSVDEPRDSDRIGCLLDLLARGYVDQILLSQDICYKIQLGKYGGKGYTHILSNIVPHLRKAGVSEGELQKILVENPRKILSISS